MKSEGIHSGVRTIVVTGKRVIEAAVGPIAVNHRLADLRAKVDELPGISRGSYIKRTDVLDLLGGQDD